MLSSTIEEDELRKHDDPVWKLFCLPRISFSSSKFVKARVSQLNSFDSSADLMLRRFFTALSEDTPTHLSGMHVWSVFTREQNSPS